MKASIEAEKKVYGVPFVGFRSLRDALIKKGLVSGKCREEGAYYYSRNGATARERSAGSVVWAMVKIAKGMSIPVDDLRFNPCSWSAKWPRTISSVKIENDGVGNFWELIRRIDLQMKDRGMEFSDL